MKRRVNEHPFWQDAQLLRDQARVLLRWARSPNDHSLPPVALRPGEDAMDKVRQYQAAASVLEDRARADEAWLRGEV